MILQDTEQSPTGLVVRIFEGKNQRLASSGSDKEVGSNYEGYGMEE